MTVAKIHDSTWRGINMGRRKKDEGLVATLLACPWWVSAIVGCIAFIGMRWIIPSFFAKHSVLFALSGISRSLAWLPLFGCGAIAAIVYSRSKASIANVRLRDGDGMAARAMPAPVAMPASSESDGAWGRSIKDDGRPPHPLQQCTAWSPEALHALEWKRFELLCAKYYESVGFRAETIRCGADGGIDVKLFKLDTSKPIAIVQCKAWNTQAVGVKEIRELLGVMAHEKIDRGIFLTTGTYTKEALAFGATKPTSNTRAGQGARPGKPWYLDSTSTQTQTGKPRLAQWIFHSER